VARSAADQGASEDPIVLTDPAAIRALAHPVRLAVIDALLAGDELTATECAALVGISPSAMSYHLRALERYGVAVRAPGRGDGRQRPWRRAGTTLQVDLSDSSQGQAAATATEFLIETTMADDRRRLVAWASSEPEDEVAQQWRRAMVYERRQVVVTPEEAGQLRESIDAIVGPYETEARTDPPAGAERMVMSLLMVRDTNGRELPE
jgi:DNA-binding transcriptional ArsR family regulator